MTNKITITNNEERVLNYLSSGTYAKAKELKQWGMYEAVKSLSKRGLLMHHKLNGYTKLKAYDPKYFNVI